MNARLYLLSLMMFGSILLAGPTSAGLLELSESSYSSPICSDFNQAMTMAPLNEPHRHLKLGPALNLKRLLGRGSGLINFKHFGNSPPIAECTPAPNTIHEYDLATNPRLVVSPDDVVIIFLEHPRARGNRDDSHGVNGIDAFSLCFDTSENYSLTAEIEPDRAYTVELFDSNGVLQGTLDDTVSSLTLAADATCWQVQLSHAQKTRNSLTLFLAPVPGGGLISHNCPGCDLSGQNLSDRDLSGSNLRGANLSRSNLTNTNLLGTDLTGADLTGTATDANAGTYAYPQDCAVVEAANPDLFPSGFCEFAPSYCASEDGGLAVHEWPKHGSCTSLSQEEYYTEMNKTMQNALASDGIRFLSENTGKTVSLNSILERFGGSDMVALGCDVSCDLERVGLCFEALTDESVGERTKCAKVGVLDNPYDNSCQMIPCRRITIASAGEACDPTAQATPLLPNPYGGLPSATRSDFQSYVLALTWTNDFCRCRNNFDQCILQASDPEAFGRTNPTLHGLWPQYDPAR